MKGGPPTWVRKQKLKRSQGHASQGSHATSPRSTLGKGSRIRAHLSFQGATRTESPVNQNMELVATCNRLLFVYKKNLFIIMLGKEVSYG